MNTESSELLAERDKPISGRVNGKIWEAFKEICRRKNISPNACLNILISDYVHTNKDIINDRLFD